MQVSVENLEGSTRKKVKVSVSAETMDTEIDKRLRKLAGKVKMDGFRPGKAPFDRVVKHFSNSVRSDVANDMMKTTFRDAIKEKNLNIAGRPSIELEVNEKGKDFVYSAIIEVFPEFEIKELNNDKVEQISAAIKDSDVDSVIEKLREQNKDWQEVSRAVADGDKVEMDFEGFLDDKPFQGGSAKGHELVIGSGAFIPGFEEALIGKKAGKSFDIKVTFPKDYNSEMLAGKETTFKITLHKVMEGILPELNDDFAAKFDIEKGGIEAFREDIKKNLTLELERKVNAINREKVYDKFLELNPIELPNALVDQEIDQLKHEMYHRIFGNEHHDNEQIPDFPSSLFEDQARRRVHLGLLFSEYVKKHQLTPDQARVDEMIEKIASSYEEPETARNWFKQSKERLAEIESLVMEQVVTDKISENAKIVKKTMSYDDISNYKQTTKEEEN